MAGKGHNALDVNALASELVSAFQSVTNTAVLPLTAALELFKASTSGTIALMEKFVAKSNPAEAFQFNRALDDLAATMGQILLPVFQSVTGFIRHFADVLDGLQPAIDPIMQGISQAIDELGRLLEPIAELMVPAFELIGAVVQNVLLPALHLLVSGLTEVANFIKEMLRSFGVEIADFHKGDSQGKAVRGASYSKNIEDIGKRTTLSALQIGKPRQQTTEDLLRKNNQNWDELFTKLADKVVGALVKPLEGTFVEDLGRFLSRNLGT